MHYESRDMFRRGRFNDKRAWEEVSDTPVPKRKPNKDEVNI